MPTEKVPKSSKKFVCNYCDYKTSRKSQYERHIYTDKHKKHEIATNSNIKVPKSSDSYICPNCNKNYKDRTGLWRHNKKCIANNNFNETTNQKDLLMHLMNENKELKQMMLDVIKSGTHQTTTNNNKTFNLNVFLNETCKNAMNITDFVNSLEIHLSDFEKLGDIGYVNGMSNLIIKNLKEMDITERPVHCTDKKREVLYVKDNNKWDKETQDKPKLRKVIKQVAHKNALLLQEFKEKYPDCMKSNSRHADTYNKLIIEAMGGKDYEEEEQEDKIIKRLAKEISLCASLVTIDET